MASINEHLTQIDASTSLRQLSKTAKRALTESQLTAEEKDLATMAMLSKLDEITAYISEGV